MSSISSTFIFNSPSRLSMSHYSTLQYKISVNYCAERRNISAKNSGSISRSRKILFLLLSIFKIFKPSSVENPFFLSTCLQCLSKATNLQSGGYRRVVLQPGEVHRHVPRGDAAADLGPFALLQVRGEGKRLDFGRIWNSKDIFSSLPTSGYY